MIIDTTIFVVENRMLVELFLEKKLITNFLDVP